MRVISLACAVALAVACLLPGAARLQAQGKKTQPKVDSFFSGPPFTLDDILQRVGVIAPKRLGTAIERRGVTFSPTREDYERLKKAGATGELINIIQAKAPPPPPPPKPEPKPQPPPRAGLLTLSCAPVDCEVVINGRPRGRTIDGKLELRDLPAGQAIIDFQKEGFEGQQVTVSLRAGTPATNSVTLKATPATQERAGRMVLDKMLERLGGGPAFQQASLLSASGNASLWQAGGQRTEWQVTSKLKLPAMALIEISGAKLKWWTSLNGADSKASGTRQMAGGPVALEMEKLVRLYRDYQPALLMPRLSKMNVLSPQGAAGLGGVWLVLAVGQDGAYQITLDKEATPLRVVYESPSGLGSGMQVLYADYALFEKAWYPKSMTIKFNDQAQHGMELHFNEVEFGGKLTDKDFHR